MEFSVESAQLIEEEEVEVLVSKEPSNMDIDKPPADVASSNETDVHMHEAPVTENGAQETVDNPVHMEADTKVRNYSPPPEINNSIKPHKELLL